MVTNKMSHELQQKQIKKEIKKSKLFLSIISTLGLGFLMLFNSCQKTDDTTDQTQADAAVVSDFLKMSVASTTCTKDSADTLRRHSRLDITQIDIATLPTAINSYISSNYAGSTIDKAGTDLLGNYYVRIMNADGTYSALEFNAAGEFVKVLLKKQRKHDGTDIAVSALPVSITSYISTNYAGVTIHKAELESDGTYKVLIVLTDNSFIGLSFDSSGNFIAAISVKEKSGRKKGKKH